MPRQLLTQYEPVKWFLCYDAPYMLAPIITLINISPTYREDEIRETVQAYLDIFPRHLYNDLKIQVEYDKWLENNKQFFYATQTLQSYVHNPSAIRYENSTR
jgi:hypothetical protein